MFLLRNHFGAYLILSILFIATLPGGIVQPYEAYARTQWVVSQGQPVAVVYYRTDSPKTYWIHNGIALAKLTEGRARTPLGHYSPYTWPNEEAVCFHGQSEAQSKAVRWVRVATEPYSYVGTPIGFRVNGTEVHDGAFVHFDLLGKGGKVVKSTSNVATAMLYAKQGRGTLTYAHWYFEGTGDHGSPKTPIVFTSKASKTGNIVIKRLSTIAHSDCP